MDKDVNVNLTLSVETLNVIMACLAKMPYEAVFGIINNIKSQAESQLRQMAQPSEPS